MAWEGLIEYMRSSTHDEHLENDLLYSQMSKTSHCTDLAFRRWRVINFISDPSAFTLNLKQLKVTLVTFSIKKLKQTFKIQLCMNAFCLNKI